MTLKTVRTAVAVIALVGAAGAATVWAQSQALPGDFKKVSTLVALPDFIPGLGSLSVDPRTLPVGPFLAHDRQGRLIGTIYMVPVKDLEAKKAFTDLAAARERVDHVDVTYNAGHPGVAEPHYHIAVWYVSRDQVANLK